MMKIKDNGYFGIIVSCEPVDRVFRVEIRIRICENER